VLEESKEAIEESAKLQVPKGAIEEQGCSEEPEETL